MKIRKEIYKYVDYELQHYEENKKELERMKLEIIEKSPQSSDGQPRGNMCGNPTEQKAIKLVSSVAIRKIEQNIRAIERVKNTLNSEYSKFFELNYILRVGIVKTCREANISEKTYYRWRDNIVYATGKEMGLI